MVAYSYKGRFEKQIRAGIKPQTMRNERKRHARPGEVIQHYVAMRTKHCRKLGISVCTAVSPVRIDFKRASILVEGRGLIHGAEKVNAFAVKDGFDDWADMRDFWMREHGKKKNPDGTPAPPLTKWSGVLIEWRDFKPAQNLRQPPT